LKGKQSVVTSVSPLPVALLFCLPQPEIGTFAKGSGKTLSKMSSWRQAGLT